ncbi:MAG: globin-coupled sensor protein [Rhodospirillaceae bacterium]|nr:globin-coupled sensor protein [Rhodospirillales bacterium]
MLDRTAPDVSFFDTARRLDFLGLNDTARAALAEAWVLVEPGLPAILGDFYAMLGRQGVFGAMLGDGGAVPRLKGAQTEHWRALFSGRFDESYMARVYRVGVVHQRIGLEPRWYMGGYAFIQERLLALLAAGCGRDATRCARLAGVMIKAVTLDMDLAIASYFRAMEAAQAARLSDIAQAFENDVKQSVEVVAQAAEKLRATAATVSDLAVHTGERAGEVAGLADQTSSNVQSVASASEQLTASIAEIGRQAVHSASVAETGVARAGQTAQAVSDLVDAAGRIAEVARMIGQVAGQTHMLALNATIEAARAGEAGKGFAVVAGEVKQLANQTAKATGAIGEQVAAIRAVTEQAMGALDGMGNTINSVAQAAQAIASAVEEQSAATAEISRGANAAAQSTEAVTASIHAVDVAAGQGGASAQQVLEASGEMARQAAQLSRRVGDFLAQLRAA